MVLAGLAGKFVELRLLLYNGNPKPYILCDLIDYHTGSYSAKVFQGCEPIDPNIPSEMFWGVY